MFNALQKAFAQLGDPRLRMVIVKSLLLAIVFYALLWGGLYWAVKGIPLFEIGWAPAFVNSWLNSMAHWLAGLAAFLLPLLLFPAFFGIMVGLFLDEVADAVEAKHYPHLGPAPGTPFMVGLWSGVKFLLLLIGVNILLLPVYLVLLLVPPTSLLLLYAVNGWLCGREYQEQVGIRRLTMRDTGAIRKANGGPVWRTGVAIAVMGSVPILNLLAPVVGTAMMVHVFQTLRQPYPMTQRPMPAKATPAR